MKNYKIIVQYDGTRYCGWQVQKNTPDTIQEKLEKILSTLAGHPVEVMGSGRTDAGVHALGQVANFHIEDDFSPESILDAFNKYLPRDIAVLFIEEADGRFHSRLSAQKKTYIYRIHTSPVPNVFERKYVYDYGQPLDTDAIKQASALLVGTHDFMSFCGNKHIKKSTVRTIYSIEVANSKNEIVISYTGNGFLMNMVRILTGTLIEIGSGKRPVESIPAILNALDREAAGFTAPPQGLALKEVFY